MKGKNAKTRYCSLYLAPEVRQHLYDVVEALKHSHNRQWTPAKVVNLALNEWTTMIAKLNDTEIDRLFDSYDNL